MLHDGSSKACLITINFEGPLNSCSNYIELFDVSLSLRHRNDEFQPNRSHIESHRNAPQALPRPLRNYPCGGDGKLTAAEADVAGSRRPTSGQSRQRYLSARCQRSAQRGPQDSHNAVLNSSDFQQHITIAINGAKLASSGHLYCMAPDSIDATVLVGKKPEVQMKDRLSASLPTPLQCARLA